MFKGKLFNSGIWKPKNPHSLEYLKYLQGLLVKNATVTDQNKGLLVEALRSIAEILIWGDQNDATVFDFFLEKNMLSFFLKILNQKCGRYVCVQLLQTLNILFENIRHETSLYYLLSNNHVNSIITYKFDFSDEEIMAYYISFLKILSLKLNGNTIHFFFNEQTSEFPLYTEAIKFLNHSEGMVRIAVRTITLNVWRVKEPTMMSFILNHSATPYFSNLVEFIRNHIMEINKFIKADKERKDLGLLDDLIAEHIDHIHYVNDVLCLKTETLSDVLVEKLFSDLLLPVYIGSLAPEYQPTEPHVSKVVALFLLTQMFLIITHESLVQNLLLLLIKGTRSDLDPSSASKDSNDITGKKSATVTEKEKTTDGDKVTAQINPSAAESDDLENRPLYQSFLSSFTCSGTDHGAFFGLTILYAIGRNEGLTSDFLDKLELSSSVLSDKNPVCDKRILEKLVHILHLSCERGSQVRLVTVELCALVLRQLVLSASNGSYIQDQFFAEIIAAKEANIAQLLHYYRNEELFLDLFEDEYEQLQRQQLKIFFLTAEAAMLLPPSSTPFSGVDFWKRLPCGPQEEARRTIRVYFVLRQLLLDLDGGTETRLPLSNVDEFVATNDCLNLNNSDLLSCHVVQKTGSRCQRFLVADGLQLILVEPDTKRLGWGVVRLVGFLQDVELAGDKEDNKALSVTMYQPSSKTRTNSQPLLSAKFIFDDHIRCMAAKQRLSKGRLKARQYKMDLIADLLEIPPKLRTGVSASPSSGTASPVLFRSTKGWGGKAPGYASLHSVGSAVPMPKPTKSVKPMMKSPLKKAKKSPTRKPSDNKGSEFDDAIPMEDMKISSSPSKSGELKASTDDKTAASAGNGSNLEKSFVPPTSNGKSPVQDV